MTRELPKEDYVKLLIGQHDQTHRRYLIALRTTADYYGWSEEFEEWRPKAVSISNGVTLGMDPGRRGGLKYAGGRRHRICRSPSTAGNPAGLTNAFRVVGRTSLLDLAEVAHFTKGDWHWMTGPFGERISRSRWEAFYQAKSS